MQSTNPDGSAFKIYPQFDCYHLDRMKAENWSWALSSLTCNSYCKKREHVEIKSNLVILVFKTILCSLSKIRLYCSLQHSTSSATSLTFHLDSHFTSLQSHLPPCCSLKMSNVLCLSAFLHALPGTFFLPLLNDLFLYLLQVSVLNLLEKSFLTILLFILFSIFLHNADHLLTYCTFTYLSVYCRSTPTKM